MGLCVEAQRVGVQTMDGPGNQPRCVNYRKSTGWWWDFKWGHLVRTCSMGTWGSMRADGREAGLDVPFSLSGLSPLLISGWSSSAGLEPFLLSLGAWAPPPGPSPASAPGGLRILQPAWRLWVLPAECWEDRWGVAVLGPCRGSAPGQDSAWSSQCLWCKTIV